MVLLGERAWDSSGFIRQSYWNDAYEKRLGTFVEQAKLDLISKIENVGTPLGEIDEFDIFRGSEGSKKDLKDLPSDKEDLKILIPDSIKKYNSPSFFVKYGKIKDDASKYQKDKILLIRIRNEKLKDRIIATFDSSGLATMKTAQIICHKTEDASLDLTYVLGVLNSKLMNFYCTHCLVDDINKEYLKAVHLATKNPDEQKPLISLVNRMLLLNFQRDSILSMFDKLLTKFRQDKEHRPLKEYVDLKTVRELQKTTRMDEYMGKKPSNGYCINLMETEELIDYKEEGRVIGVKRRMENNYLILSVQVEGANGYRDMLKICFEDEQMQSFFELAISHDLWRKEKRKYWSKNKVFEVLDNIEIPRSVANIDSDKDNIVELMKALEEKYVGVLKEEFTDSPINSLSISKIEQVIQATDGEVDKLIYKLYDLTDEEVSIVEESIK